MINSRSVVGQSESRLRVAWGSASPIWEVVAFGPSVKRRAPPGERRVSSLRSGPRRP